MSARHGRWAYLCLSFLFHPVLCGEPVVTFSENALTINTERYEVVWRDGCMVSLRSFLPKAAELTVHSAPMNVEQLPNGLGSFFGHEKEGKEQHHPWGFFSLDTTFPAQHPPCAETQVTFQKLENGGRLTYQGLKTAKDAYLIQELTVDSNTGDLVIQQEGHSPNPGVFGVAFSLLNLRPDLRLIVPYFGGQRWGEEFAPEKIVCVAWPTFWNAGLVIGEIPGGGTFSVWAEDAAMRPKFLRWWHGKEAQGIGFESCNDAPFEDKRTITGFTWRFNTFGGSWMEPAQRYKQWLVKAHNIVQRRHRTSRWVDEIALIWPAGISEDGMKKMAKIMDPKKVLIHNWGWLKGFNRRIPEYIPQSKDAAEQAALAHRYGYRIGIYTSMALVDVETHPTILKDYDLVPHYPGLWKDKPTDLKGWLLYVHPGSAKWREFYANKMAEVHQKYGVDYLYQDVAGCGWGSCGLVDGKTFSAAVVACEAAIRQKVPQAALGGEYWTEVNVCQEDFGIGSFLAWGGQEQPGNHKDFISRSDQPHPLLSYLFSDYCVYWPHSTSIRNTKRFHQDQNINEVIGAMAVWSTRTDDRVSEARCVLERAKLWAEGFRPWFPKEWEPKAVAYMREPTGRVVKYVREGECTYCYEESVGGHKLRYGRIKGLNRVALPMPMTIDGWIAYDDKGPIGLDPTQWYCIFPGQPAESPIRITHLPDKAYICGTRVCEDYCLVQVEGAGTGKIQWETRRPFLSLSTPAGRKDGATDSVEVSLPTSLLFSFKQSESLALQAPLPLNTWRHVLVASGLTIGKAEMRRWGKFNLGNITHEGCHVQAPLGGIGSEHSIDGLVHLPHNTKLALKTSLGILGSIGDGVHFVVRINGREIWRKFRETMPVWEDVQIPLGAYAGQDVLLSLAVDCGKGGGNTSCDECVWGDPVLVESH